MDSCRLKTPLINQVGFGSNLITRHLVTLKLKLKLRPKVVSQKADKNKKTLKIFMSGQKFFCNIQIFCKNFKFHSNLNILKNTLPYFPSFYKYILKPWSKYYLNQPSLPSTIISQHLWLNSFTKIDSKVVFHRKFWGKNIC